jgi:tetratricopeptide (TPR) repeat protein
MLPLAVSCSDNKGTDPATGTDRGTAGSSDTEASRLNKVIDAATEAIRRDPNAVDDRGELAYARRAGAYAEKGDHDKAIADYTEAIRLYLVVKGPNYTARLTVAHKGRAASYAKKREYDMAIADYTEVLRLTPTGGKDLGETIMFAGVRARAHYQRGVCYDDKGDHAKAMDDYNEAFRLAPELANTTDLKKRLGK